MDRASKRRQAERLAGIAPPQAPTNLSLEDLAAKFNQWAERYYRDRRGNPTKEHIQIAYAMKALCELYGDLPAAEFTPQHLLAIQAWQAHQGYARSTVNHRIRRIKKLFKWAGQKGFVDPIIHHRLQVVEGLKAGRSEAKETDPVAPVLWKDVEAVLPHLPPWAQTAVLLMWHTGARPAEILSMHRKDLDIGSDKVWVYRPSHHKTAWTGRKREIYLNKAAQKVLKGWLKESGLSGLLFTSDRPEGHFLPKDLWKRLERACKAAGVPHWHAHQLRHAFATRVAKEAGLELAQMLLGHAHVRTTEVYVEADFARAKDFMARFSG